MKKKITCDLIDSCFQKKKSYISMYIFLSVKEVYSSGNWVKIFLFLLQADPDVPQINPNTVICR